MTKSTTTSVKSDVNISISVVNPRILKMTPVSINYEIKDQRSNIVEINYGDNVSFKENSIVSVGKQKYKVQYITKRSSKTYTPYYQLHTHSSITKTSNFIMPFLGFNKDYFKWDNGFVNSFIGLEEDDDYGNKLYLLYRFENSTKFTEFENQLTNHPQFDRLIDPDAYHTMYSFNIPNNHKEDINKALEGKYSQISSDFKERILSFHKADKDRPLYQILYKSQEKRKLMEKEYDIEIPIDNELLSPIVKEEEIYLNKYKVITNDKRWEC